jgi:selenocysteine lyase/cysteine desulfurase
MPTALEAGTLNGHGIAGLCAAVNYLLEQNVENIRQKELKLLKLFVDGVSTIPGVTLYGNPDLSKRMAIASLRIRDYDSASVSDWLWEDYEIAVRAGAHCAPLMHESLGTKEQGLVRFSFSHFNTEKEIETAIQAVKELAEE